jgi:glycine C-acetyltransferase
MAIDRLAAVLAKDIARIDGAGTSKRRERVVVDVVPAKGAKGPRLLLEGEGLRDFIRMNSNGYLGLALDEEVEAAEDEAVRRYGTGPGAVRFISGTWQPHAALERRLGDFHGRPAAMIFSSAYAAVMGTLPPLITEETAVISDELNHNCIINAMRLARPAEKHIYRHLDMADLEACLEKASAACKRAVVVTDGVFSMRGDHGPLDEIVALAARFDDRFAENAIVVADDSHGVGALGPTGRGTEEVTGATVDLLVATLGKAVGVNGGYVAGGGTVIDYLRETSPFYIYSNPITPGEAAAALAALDLIDGPRGRALLDHLRAMAARFRDGLLKLGLETIAGEHPIVPLLVRDTHRTKALVESLFARGVIATAISYPVVPKGEDEIRFQIAADHTASDIDEVLAHLAELRNGT